MTPPFVIHADEVPEEVGRYPAPFDAEALSAGRDLGRAAGSERLGVWRERLPPGRRTSRAHAHSREEEAVYVLSGAPVLRWAPLGGEFTETPLRAGSFVSFPAGTGIAHTVVNPGPGEVELLVLGERDPADRGLYPEDPDLEEWRAARRPHRQWGDWQPALPWPHALRTARLRLRLWRPEEAPAFLALVREGQARLAAWMPWAADLEGEAAYSRRFAEWAAASARQEEAIFGLFLPDGTPIGGCGLHPRIGAQALEIGYWISQAHEGKGYITEAVAALCRVGLGPMGQDRLEIRCDPDNHRSAAVPARLGFTLEATLPRRLPDGQGALRPCMVWALYRDQLAASAAAGFEVRATDRLGRGLPIQG